MKTSCGACPRPATVSWQRHATDRETRELAGGDTDAKVTVLACDDHGFPTNPDPDGVQRPSDLAAIVHQAGCQAPPPEQCSCGVD